MYTRTDPVTGDLGRLERRMLSNKSFHALIINTNPIHINNVVHSSYFLGNYHEHFFC